MNNSVHHTILNIFPKSPYMHDPQTTYRYTKATTVVSDLPLLVISTNLFCCYMTRQCSPIQSLATLYLHAMIMLGSVSSRCSGMSPRSPPERRLGASGRVRSSFVQIDQSGIRLPGLSRRNNYISYHCLHFRIHFTFFTWYLIRTFLGMFCVTDITFYVLKKLTDFLAK